ncbi:MAG: hypothetical protein ACLSCV_06840 [Acutalibacteraceae bacterium]
MDLRVCDCGSGDNFASYDHSFGYLIFYAAFANNIWVAVVLRGMQAGVAAVILDVACDLGINAAKKKKYIVLLFLLQPLFVILYFK